MAKSKSSDILRFISLELENWRNFSKARVDLEKRTLVVGPNAAGKSNFLDVFRFLRDVASIGGGLAEAVRDRGGVSSLRALTARRYPDIRICVRIGSDDDPEEWVYELSFSQDNLRRPQVKREYVQHRNEVLLARPTPEDESDPERLTQTHLEQIQTNQEFREIADFLRRVNYLHVVPQLVREPDRSIGRENDPYGGDFLKHVYQTNEKTKRARLRQITEALQVAVPQLQELELIREDNTGAIHLRGRYEHWRAQGAWQDENQLSDGTLRLIGLLWATLEGTGPLLLEEPELSLHPEVVRYLPQMFARAQRQRGRQILLSTHSPEMLQDSGIGLDEVVILTPTEKGTKVSKAEDYSDVVTLLSGGLSMADAVMPKTSPRNVEQLALFGQ